MLVGCESLCYSIHTSLSSCFTPPPQSISQLFVMYIQLVRRQPHEKAKKRCENGDGYIIVPRPNIFRERSRSESFSYYVLAQFSPRENGRN